MNGSSNSQRKQPPLQMILSLRNSRSTLSCFVSVRARKVVKTLEFLGVSGMA